MAKNFRKIFSGLQLIGQNTITPDLAGEMRYNSTSNRLQTFDTALRNITTDDGVATLTNKTISAASTTLILTNFIVNADINTAAAIAYSKLNLTGSILNADLAGSIDLTTKVTGALPIINGGTGQSTQTNAFDALAPSTTKGDLLVHNGTDNIRIPVGTNSQVLTADSAEVSGVKWTNSAVANNSIDEFKLTTSVAGDGLSGGNGIALAVNVDNSTIEINSDTLRLKDLGITTAKLGNNQVTRAKLEAVGQQISSSSGSFLQNGSSGAFVDITNLSITITTTGRPVVLKLNGTTANSVVKFRTVGGLNQTSNFKWLRDSTDLEVMTYNSVSIDFNHFTPGSYFFIDTPSAGTYTYKLQVAASGTVVSGNYAQNAITECVLFAYEL